jgi:branched-chain amino acid transport system substrate-binding protein
VDVQNAQGGVDGRQLRIVTADTTSSAAGAQAAAQELVQQKHVFAIAVNSAFTYGAARYLNQQGIPVTGEAYDGPEWGQQPNTNMFSAIASDPQDPAYTTLGQFLKTIGAKRYAGFAYADSPSSENGVKDSEKSVETAGLSNVYDDLAVPFGTVNYTAEVLQLKSANVDVFECSCVESSDIALATAVKQGGSTAKGLFDTGYAQLTLDQPSALAAAQGQYFVTSTVPFEYNTAPTTNFLAALKKYDTSYKGGIPAYGDIVSWVAMDLMIKGLEQGGTNLTRSSFMQGLRQVSSYDADGLLPSSVNFALSDFGTAPATECTYWMQLQGNKFVPLKPTSKFCGTLIPNSNVG